jgi:probable F420-dependent oxidoreductase
VIALGLRFPSVGGPDPGGFAAGVARVAEASGIESVWTVEHVVVAHDYQPLYPYSADGKIPGSGHQTRPSPMADPLETLAYIAAVTTTMKLGTSVVVAPLHSAAVLAKRAATLDLLSGGRLLLGLGIGWQVEEYAAVGAPFDHRGERFDEIIEAMRRLWADSPASFDGKYTRFDAVYSEPRPAGGRVPVVIGGSSPAAAARAGRLGDGWLPFVISAEDFAARAAEIREVAKRAGRDPDEVELTAWPGSFDAAREDDLDAVAPYVAAGASRLLIRPNVVAGDDPERLAEQVDNYHRKVLDRL